MNRDARLTGSLDTIDELITDSSVYSLCGILDGLGGGLSVDEGG